MRLRLITRPIGAFLSLGVFFMSACRPTIETDKESIRRAREESNEAIAAHDTVRLARCLTIDYNVVTSRNAVSADRGILLERLAADWTVKPDLVYRRTPEKIELFSAWRMAGEKGTWMGTWTEPNGDNIRLSGSYYAKWHKEDGRWLIRAEVFTPLRCEGGTYCDKGPLDNL